MEVETYKMLIVFDVCFCASCRCRCCFTLVYLKTKMGDGFIQGMETLYITEMVKLKMLNNIRNVLE